MTVTQTISRQQLSDALAKVPREQVAILPTALEEAPRLREALGPDAPRILIKRDDLTGLAFGGNKVRHLEFRLADMLAKGCDALVVTNVAQSNHARLHTALGAKYGLDAYIIKIPSHKDEPVNGNLLLDHIMGATIIEAPDAEPVTIAHMLEELIIRLDSEGSTVYNVPNDPFSKIAGTCGYVNGAIELLDQLGETGAIADHVYLASGTSSAGLALAGKALGARYRVHPVSVGQPRAELEEHVCTTANGVSELLRLDVELTAGDVSVHDEFIGERYGVPTAAGLEALRLVGRREGLILDPVYTAKAMSALINHIRQGRIGRDETVVFVHTGGLPITYAYAPEIMANFREADGEGV